MINHFYFLLSLWLFIGGIFIASYLSASLEFFLAIAIGVIIVVVILVLFCGNRDFVLKNFFLILFLFFAFSLGFWHFKFISSKSFGDFSGSKDIIGVIVSEAKIKESFAEYKMLPLSPDKEKFGGILIRTRIYPQYYYGDIVKISGKILTPSPVDGFDYRSYLAKNRIYYVSYYPNIIKIEKDSNFYHLGIYDSFKILLFKNLYTIKNFFVENLKNNLVEPSVSLISGVIFGDSSGFSGKLTEVFKKVGISHITAVSGYNVTIIILSLYILLEFFYFNREQKFYIVIFIILIYAIVCGLEASVVRAAIMGSLLLVTRKEKRLYASHSAISVAAFIMLLENPLILKFDAGFKLSFAATLGLIFVYPIFMFGKDIFVPDKSDIKLIFKDTFFSTFSAQIVVFPLLVYLFGRFSLVSILVNILIVPVVPLLMFLGFLGGIFSILLPWFGKIFVFPAYLISMYVIKISEFFAGLNLGFLEIKHFGFIFVIFYYSLLITIIYLINRKRKKDYVGFKRIN